MQNQQEDYIELAKEIDYTPQLLKLHLQVNEQSIVKDRQYYQDNLKYQFDETDSNLHLFGSSQQKVQQKFNKNQHRMGSKYNRRTYKQIMKYKDYHDNKYQRRNVEYIDKSYEIDNNPFNWKVYDPRIIKYSKTIRKQNVMYYSSCKNVMDISYHIRNNSLKIAKQTNQKQDKRDNHDVEQLICFPRYFKYDEEVNKIYSILDYPICVYCTRFMEHCKDDECLKLIRAQHKVNKGVQNYKFYSQDDKQSMEDIQCLSCQRHGHLNCHQIEQIVDGIYQMKK